VNVQSLSYRSRVNLPASQHVSVSELLSSIWSSPKLCKLHNHILLRLHHQRPTCPKVIILDEVLANTCEEGPMSGLTHAPSDRGS
jgi:hypothetical protein